MAVVLTKAADLSLVTHGRGVVRASCRKVKLAPPAATSAGSLIRRDIRTTGRGGKGIVAMSVNDRRGKLVASFPVEDRDQIMLVTDRGQLIRCPVEDIRVAGRSTQGVIVFDTADDEHVVSVEHIGEDAENGNGG